MNRDTFVIWTLEHLSGSGPFLDIQGVARYGLQEGVLTVSEAARIEGHALLPHWLSNALTGETQDLSPSVVSPSVTVSGHLHTVPPPILLGSSRLPSSFEGGTGDSPDVKAFSGQNGVFVVQNFLNAAFLDDGYIADLTNVKNLWAWSILRKREPTRLAGRTLVAVVEGSSVLSHWLFDTLPKIELGRIFSSPLSKFDQVLLTTRHTSFHRQSLAALSIAESQIRVRAQTGPVVACEEFFTVSQLRSGFFADNWVYDLIRDRFYNGEKVDQPWRKLYISRARASRRRIVNEADLQPILERRGFSVIRAEEKSLAEMAQLMHEASHVVAPHGAGLSNLVFANERARVMEIFGAHLSTEFWKLSSSRGLSYFALQAKAATEEAFSQSQLEAMGFFEMNFADMYVPPAEFDVALDQFMQT